MADVQVTFGAKIDDLVRAVNDVKSQLDGLKSKFDEVKQHTESISDTAGSISNAFKLIATTIGAAFSIEGIANFSHNMADLGSRLESIKYSLGLSAQEVVNLATVAKLTGTDIGTLTSGIERMSLNIQRATRDSTNPFAQALKNLGLSTKDFIGLRGDQYFEKLSEAVSKFNPSMNLTTNLTQLVGRGAKDMIPSLMQGAEAFRVLGESVKAARESIAAAQPGMVDTHEKLTLLSVEVEGLRARIFIALKPAIDAIIERFTAWAKSIDAGMITSVAQSIGSAMISIMESLSGFILEVIELIDRLKRSLGDLDQFVDNFRGDVMGKAVTKMRGSMAEQWEKFNLEIAAAIGSITETGKQRLKEFYDTADKAAAEGNERMEKRRADFKAVVDGFRSAIEGITSTLGAPGKEAATAPPKGGGATAPALKFPGSGGEELAAAQRQIAQIDQLYQIEVEKINHAFKMSADFFGSAEAQKTSALLSAVQQRLASELSVLEAVQAKYAAGSKEYERIEDEKTKIIQKAALERLRIENQAAEKSWEKWKSASSDISGAFTSHLREMMTGTMTFSQAIGRTLGDLILKWTGDLAKMAIEWVAKQLFMAATGKAILGTDVAAHVGAEAAKTTATTTGVAARTSAEAAGSSMNIFAKIGEAITFIFTQAAKVFAGVFAFLSPAMGPAAAGPAAASSAEVMAVAATVPALAVGTDYVHRAGLAMIHEGEQVVPAKTSGAYTGANAGGTNVHITLGPVWDGPSVQRWLSSGGSKMIAKAASSYTSRNPSSRPKY